MDDPNPDSPAQAEAYGLFKKDRAAYDRKIKLIVRVSFVTGGAEWACSRLRDFAASLGFQWDHGNKSKADGVTGKPGSLGR